MPDAVETLFPSLQGSNMSYLEVHPYTFITENKNCLCADASSWAWRRARLASALSAIVVVVVVRLQVEECLCRVFDMLQLKELCGVNQAFTVSNLLALSLFLFDKNCKESTRWSVKCTHTLCVRVYIYARVRTGASSVSHFDCHVHYYLLQSISISSKLPHPNMVVTARWRLG